MVPARMDRYPGKISTKRSLHDCVSCRCLEFCRRNIQLLYVLLEDLGVFLGIFQRVGVIFLCPLDDLIVYVGDVLNVINFVFFVTKIFSNNIKKYKSPRITDVGIFINRRSADEHFNLAFFTRQKLFFLAGNCIQDLCHENNDVLATNNTIIAKLIITRVKYPIKLDVFLFTLGPTMAGLLAIWSNVAIRKGATMP